MHKFKGFLLQTCLASWSLRLKYGQRLFASVSLGFFITLFISGWLASYTSFTNPVLWERMFGVWTTLSVILFFLFQEEKKKSASSFKEGYQTKINRTKKPVVRKPEVEEEPIDIGNFNVDEFWTALMRDKTKTEDR